MLETGVILMLAGMGIVFAFLFILVYSTRLMSAIVKRYEEKHPTAPVKPKSPAAVVSAAPGDDMAKIAAVIAIAQRECGLV